MPRVSEAHLAARRRQILDAANHCFVRNGFHGTSMQDVIGEAGLSVGAVYRYFTGKHELIKAIAEENLGKIIGTVDEFAMIEPQPPLRDLAERIMDLFDAESEEETGMIRLAVQVWGESLRDPELAAMVTTIYRAIRGRCVVLAERARAAGQLGKEADPAAVAAALFGLTIGYAIQRLLIGDPDRVEYIAGIHGLMTSASSTVTPNT